MLEKDGEDQLGTDQVEKDEVLERTNEERNIPHKIKQRKAN